VAAGTAADGIDVTLLERVPEPRSGDGSALAAPARAHA